MQPAAPVPGIQTIGNGALRSAKAIVFGQRFHVSHSFLGQICPRSTSAKSELNWERSVGLLLFSIPTRHEELGTSLIKLNHTNPWLVYRWFTPSLSRIAYNCPLTPFIGPKAMPCWWAPLRAKQLSMATNAWVIWLCACVKCWPGCGLVYVCPLF